MPIVEVGLDELVADGVTTANLTFTDSAVDAVAGAEFVFLCVPTPQSSDGSADLSYVESAAKEIAAHLEPGSVVVNKSTVPVGSGNLVGAFVRDGVLEAHPDLVDDVRFGVASNPEFLREGSAVTDFMEPDRIVIGQWDAASGQALAGIYRAFDCPKLFTTLRNAEMTKYASNALLATLVSFSNEFAALCEATPGTDVEEVLNALHFDRRLSPVHNGTRTTPGIVSYLRAGCGFGGSCLPKDVSALRDFARKHGVVPSLLDAVAAVNAARPAQVVAMAVEALGSLDGAEVAVLGLAFKPGTDDVRDSPALAVIAKLESQGARIRAYDPMVAAISGIRVCGSARQALSGADAAILVTAWPEFADLDWNALSQTMRRPILIDGRNALPAATISEGINCIPIGRHFRPEGVSLAR